MALVDTPLSDQKILRCCSGTPIKKITYDAGIDETTGKTIHQKFLVCKDHYSLDRYKKDIILEEDL